MAFLNIKTEYLSPPQLIQLLLKAPVDLLWLGGIGTFVKASTEKNADVKDPMNDALRVNGQEIQAKVVGEGANLGFTQKGRIEYALKGGHLNTDALDNSAGVDCSDHEVNIKLLFQPLLHTNALTLTQRNHILEEIKDEVEALVLLDNYWQNQAVSLAHFQTSRTLKEQSDLMRELERLGQLNRALEALPDEAELRRRQSLHQGLSRPEICVLLAYTKMNLYQDLLASSLLDDPYLEQTLLSYFPKKLSKDFKKILPHHPLKREIIATLITNTTLNTLGLTFIHEIKKLTKITPDKIVKIILIAKKILGVEDIEETIPDLSLPAPSQKQLLESIGRSVKSLTLWFLKQGKENNTIQEILDLYASNFKMLSENFENILPPTPCPPTLKKKATFFSFKPSFKTIVSKITLLEPLSQAGPLLELSFQTNTPFQEIAKLYSSLSEVLSIRWILETLQGLPTENSCHHRTVLQKNLLSALKILTTQISAYAENSIEEKIKKWKLTHQPLLSRYEKMRHNARKLPTPNGDSLNLLALQLQQLAKKTQALKKISSNPKGKSL